MIEQPLFAVCIKNEGYTVSLERHKIYRVLPDLEVLFHGHGALSAEPWIVSHIEPGLAGASAIATHWHNLFEASNA